MPPLQAIPVILFLITQVSTYMAFQLASRSLRNVILFDGVCNFCNGWVDTVIRLDPAKKFKFAALQSVVGQEILQSLGKDSNDISSVVYIRSLDADSATPPMAFFKSDAALQVAKDLGVPSFLVSSLEIGFRRGLRDSFYDLVAENRYNLLGKRNSCRIASDDIYKDRFLA